ncbi:MAG: hypothetical protein V4575_09305 [Pseudomonadota bacterium]
MYKTSSAILLSICLISCGGRAANPVMVQQYGDQNASCAGIEKELGFIESEVTRLAPQTDKSGKNAALGVTGAVFLIPLFFMDFSKAEQIEVDAYRRRYNHLLILAEDKKCGINKQQIPDTAPVPAPQNPAP